jgi:hypothetical protein
MLVCNWTLLRFCGKAEYGPASRAHMELYAPVPWKRQLSILYLCLYTSLPMLATKIMIMPHTPKTDLSGILETLWVYSAVSSTTRNSPVDKISRIPCQSWHHWAAGPKMLDGRGWSQG